MNYSQARKYLLEIDEKCGIMPGLDNVKNLFDIMGNPWKNKKIIHVAGTNGKGSVCTFISCMLSEMGYKVGRYISPVTDGYTEKIQYTVNSDITYISENEVAEFLTSIRDSLKENIASAFEIETVMAFMAFDKWECDYIVLECGMGGRLDATNAIGNKEMCVFASISEDHKSFLGSTLKEIAQEKSGIIIDNVACISCTQPDDVKAVLDLAAKNHNTSFVYPSKYKVNEISLEGSKFIYDGQEWVISLCGEYQISNAVTAIEAVKNLGINIDIDAMKKGLKKASWKNRFQIIGKDPYIVVDGAHNPDAAKRLRESIETIFPKEQYRRVGVMGVFADKDVSSILNEMKDVFEEIHVIKAPGKRGMDIYELKNKINEVNNGLKVIVHEDKNAIEAAKTISDADVVVIFGSLSLCSKAD